MSPETPKSNMDGQLPPEWRSDAILGAEELEDALLRANEILGDNCQFKLEPKVYPAIERRRLRDRLIRLRANGIACHLLSPWFDVTEYSVQFTRSQGLVRVTMELRPGEVIRSVVAMCDPESTTTEGDAHQTMARGRFLADIYRCKQELHEPLRYMALPIAKEAFRHLYEKACAQEDAACCFESGDEAS